MASWLSTYHRYKGMDGFSMEGVRLTDKNALRVCFDGRTESECLDVWNDWSGEDLLSCLC